MTSEAGYPPEDDERIGQSRFTLPDVPEANTPFSAFGTPPRPAEPASRYPDEAYPGNEAEPASRYPDEAYPGYEPEPASRYPNEAYPGYEPEPASRYPNEAYPGYEPEPASRYPDDAYPGYDSPEASLPQRTAMNPDEFGPQPGAASPPYSADIPPAYPSHQTPPQAAVPPQPPVPPAQARAAVRVPGTFPPQAASVPSESAVYGSPSPASLEPRVYGRARSNDDAPAAEAPVAPPFVASARVSVPGAVPPRYAPEQAPPISPVPVSASPSGGPVGSASVAPSAARPMAAWQDQFAQSAAAQSVPPTAPPTGAAASVPPVDYDRPILAPQASDEPEYAGASKLRVVGYISIALLVILLGIGALYYTARPNPPTYKVGSCVAEDGGKAAQVACSEPGAYQIVSKVSDHAQCPDPTQPYATIAGGSILCLKPKS